MSTETKDPLDMFMDALGDMIDAQDDMWEEEKYSNIREMWMIKDQRYTPAKEKAKEFLRECIRKELGQLSSASRAPD